MRSVNADRGTTTTLSYVLALSITVLLSSGLLIAAGGTVESVQESTAREELRVVGQAIDSRMLAVDRLSSVGGETVVVEMSAPDRVAGTAYSVEVEEGPPARLYLNATDIGESVAITVPTNRPVVPTRVSGGDLRIVLTDESGADKLEVRSA